MIVQRIVDCLLQHFGAAVLTLYRWDYERAIDILLVDDRTVLVVDTLVHADLFRRSRLVRLFR